MTQMDEQEQKKVNALLNEVAATVDIAEVRFTSFSARNDLVLEQGTALEVQLKCKAAGRAEGPSDPKIVVLADFVMEARRVNDASGVPCCEIQAQIAVIYASPKAMEFSPEHLAAFAQINGIHNAWPYWRELVQSSTARMGLPSFIVPSLKLGVVSHEKKKDDQSAKEDGKATASK